MSPAQRARNTLLDGLDLDAPYVTETRRLLQNLYRPQKSGQAENRSYMVTSAGRGEGKSTICALMAIVSARIFHKRTLLVDGDLYRPTIHKLLGVAQGPGVFEVLRSGTEVHEATRSTSLPQLSAIPSGYPREAISESYADEEFGRLIQALRPSYDVIFVDAPPAVPAIEPILMAEHIDAIIVIAMAGRTPLAMVRRSIEVLAPVADKIVGIVLNNALERLPYHYNYRYYGYESPRLSRFGRTDKPGQPEQNAQKRAKNTGGGN